MTDIAFEKYAPCRFKEGAYGKRQAEAAAIFENALAGDLKAKNRLFEALTTSDTPALLEPAFNRRILTGYIDGYERMWTSIASKEVADDFRSQELNKFLFAQGGIPSVNGGVPHINGTLPRVAEGDEYPVLSVNATGITWRVAKSGEQFALTWERIVNNRDLSELERALNIFGVHSAQTEDVEATRQFLVKADGTAFGITNTLPAANLLSGAGTAALTSASLKTALAQAVAQKVDGRAVNPRGGFNLIVPPALELTANEILNDYEVQKGTNPIYKGPNPLAGKFTVVVDEWFSALDPTNGDKTWVVAPKPGSLGEAEGIAVGFLRGHENPEMSIKSSDRFGANGERIEGVSGDFDTDSFATRVRHTATGLTKSFAGWVGSNGTV